MFINHLSLNFILKNGIDFHDPQFPFSYVLIYLSGFVCFSSLYAGVKVFKIIPEFSILMLTFHPQNTDCGRILRLL